MTEPSYLYPRLPAAAAREAFEASKGLEPDELMMRAALQHPSEVFAATGGVRVPEEHLQTVQDGIRSIAREAGWPDNPTVQQRLYFDAAGARYLADELGIIPSDAGSDGVWMFMSLVLAPEIAPWRWPTWNERRFLDHPRNTFRSMYWRGYVLGYPILSEFGEDEIVAVIERPSLSANPDFARAIFKVYAPVREGLVDVGSMFVMRDYAKRIRRMTPFLCVDALSRNQMEGLLTELLIATLDAFGEKTDLLMRPPEVRETSGVETKADQSSFGIGKTRSSPERTTGKLARLWKSARRTS